jgi:hypothetical protein
VILFIPKKAVPDFLLQRRSLVLNFLGKEIFSTVLKTKKIKFNAKMPRETSKDVLVKPAFSITVFIAPSL